MERIKVLVVDDSRVSCAMLANMMSKTNFEVCGMASNAADAVLKYQTLRPMAVTMDMNLPDADGIECSRRIRESLLQMEVRQSDKLMTQSRIKMDKYVDEYIIEELSSHMESIIIDKSV